MKIALLGYGIEIKAIIPHLKSLGFDQVRIWHFQDFENDGQYDHEKYSKKLLLEYKPDLVVRSPGISINNIFVKEIIEQNITVTTPTGLWIALNPDVDIIGITGTKGKSSTAMFLFNILENILDESDVSLGGNIGIPVWSIEKIPKYLVLELSSYMTSDLMSAPKYGVLTSLSPEHLDWHGDIDKYFNDKLNMFNIKQNNKSYLTKFTHRTKPEKSFVLDNVSCDKTNFLSIELIIPDWFKNYSKKMPEHIQLDFWLAYNVAKNIVDFEGLDDEKIIKKISNEFIPLKGRMRTILNGKNIWVDDTLASNPFGVAAAIKSFQEKDIVLIIGGESRGVPLDPIINEINLHKGDIFLAGISKCGKEYIQEIAAKCNISGSEDFQSIKQLVEYANNKFENNVIVFSPGAPTPKSEGNWETRSDEFENSVKKLLSMK